MISLNSYLIRDLKLFPHHKISHDPLVLFPLALGAVEVELDFTITSQIGKLSRADVKYEIGTNITVPSTT